MYPRLCLQRLLSTALVNYFYYGPACTESKSWGVGLFGCLYCIDYLDCLDIVDSLDVWAI